MKIISGGQTGVDRAALDAALEVGVECGGWCPKGRRAEDGIVDGKYPLKETESTAYEVRTEANVFEADATLIISKGGLTSGTNYTLYLARTFMKPHLVVDLEKTGTKKSSEVVKKWISESNIQILNVAGPRESNAPGVYEEAKALLISVLKK